MKGHESDRTNMQPHDEYRVYYLEKMKDSRTKSWVKEQGGLEVYEEKDGDSRGMPSVRATA